MNKHTTTYLLQGVLGGMTVIVAGLTVLLVHEHRTVQKKVNRLIQLKKEYKVFIRHYKTMLESGNVPAEGQEIGGDDDDESDDDAEGQDDQVAEYEEEPCATFIVVNRESDYLQEAAVNFAKEHNIEQSVKNLYKDGSHEPPLLSTLVTPKRKVMRPTAPSARRRQYVPQPQELVDADFMCPLERSRFWVSSLYGPRKRKNGNWQFHKGIDMAAMKGTPVYAVANGVVYNAVRSDKGYGNCIVLAHNTKFKTRYAHLHTIDVAHGQTVKKGQKIGTVGATGFVTSKRGKEQASHLHFEVMVYDKRVNPLWVVR